MELLKQRDMKLLSRKRLTLLINNTGATPSRLELIKKIAKKFKTKEDLIVIKHIYPQFGKQKTKLIVHLYKNKKKMELFEHKNLLKKHKEPKKKDQEKPETPSTEKTPEQSSEEQAEVKNDQPETPSEKPEEGHKKPEIQPPEQEKSKETKQE